MRRAWSLIGAGGSRETVAALRAALRRCAKKLAGCVPAALDVAAADARLERAAAALADEFDARALLSGAFAPPSADSVPALRPLLGAVDKHRSALPADAETGALRV